MKKVGIQILSTVDDEVNIFKSVGEYKIDDNTHMVAYTDYTGNTITKNGLYIGAESMLLHRIGGITGDMLFDLNKDTITTYTLSFVSADFIIYTKEYKVSDADNGIEVYLQYVLTDKSNNQSIYGTQRIEIKFL